LYVFAQCGSCIAYPHEQLICPERLSARDKTI